MRITLLGLEKMRTAWAHCLVKAGHEVTLYSRSQERMANPDAIQVRVADTVAEAVHLAQVAITIVANDAAEDALTCDPGGLLQNLPAGAIHLCMSTLSVDFSRQLAVAHQGAGQGYVAAPMLGLTGATGSGNRWILAAGPETQVIRCLGILEALGQGITRLGPRAELAHALKLGASAFTVALVETLAEVLAFGERAGIPPAQYLVILNQGLFKSPLLDVLGGLMVRHDHEPAVHTVEGAAGDLTQFVQAAQALNLATPLAGPLLLQLQNAQSQGLADRDLTVLSQLRRQAQAQDQGPAAPGPRGADHRRPDRRKPGERRKAHDAGQRKAAEAANPATSENRRTALTVDPGPGPSAPAPVAPPSSPSSRSVSDGRERKAGRPTWP